MIRMELFIDSFILKSPPLRGKRIRIAVLDTGLYIDEADDDNILLRFAGDRIVHCSSRNFAGPEE